MPAELVLVEPTFRDEQHSPVNAGLLHMARLVSAHPAPALYATAAQHAAVDTILDPTPHFATSTATSPQTIVVGPSGGIRVSRLFRQLRNLRYATRGPVKRLLILSSGPETFFAARMLCWARPKLQIRIVLHGNLQDAAARRSRDPRHRLIDYVAGLRATNHPRIRLIVLEAAIQRTMHADAIPGWDRTCVMPHPINAGEFSHAPGLTDPDTITIGFIGHAKRSKGFDNFLALAHHADPRLVFKLVGFLAETFPAEALEAVDCPTEPLPRDRFLERVSSLDYACFPFKARTYAYTASASILDAACALRPIIAMAFPALRDIERTYGPIGYLCDTFDDMQTLIANPALLSDRTAYATFQANMKRLRQDRLPAQLAPLLNRIFQQHRL